MSVKYSTTWSVFKIMISYLKVIILQSHPPGRPGSSDHAPCGRFTFLLSIHGAGRDPSVPKMAVRFGRKKAESIDCRKFHKWKMVQFGCVFFCWLVFLQNLLDIVFFGRFPYFCLMHQKSFLEHRFGDMRVSRCCKWKAEALKAR